MFWVRPLCHNVCVISSWYIPWHIRIWSWCMVTLFFLTSISVFLIFFRLNSFRFGVSPSDTLWHDFTPVLTFMTSVVSCSLPGQTTDDTPHVRSSCPDVPLQDKNHRLDYWHTLVNHPGNPLLRLFGYSINLEPYTTVLTLSLLLTFLLHPSTPILHILFPAE